jgi:exonuclease III
MSFRGVASRLGSVAFAVSILLWLASSADAKCASPNGASLRLMTYNASFQAPRPYQMNPLGGPSPLLVGIDDPSSSWKLSDIERATSIVEKIFRDDPDVVVLQEVNKEGMKVEFIDQLMDKYPNFISYVGRGFFSLNDSGLMLFSKFKFTPLNNLNPEPLVSDRAVVEATIEGTTTFAEAFMFGLTFRFSSFPDSLADKGAVIARIINECDANRPFAVVATHTQATYHDHDTFEQGGENWVRQAQMKTLMLLTEGALTNGQMIREPAFLLGDLNIDGKNNGINSNNTFFENAYQGNVMVDYKYTEWQRTFNGVDPPADPALGFFACNTTGATCTYSSANTDGTFFVDSWGFEMPPTDPGQTNSGSAVGGNWLGLKPSEGERPDYVLHNKPAIAVGAETRRLCLQYMKRGLEYFDDTQASDDPTPPTGEALSDHAPVLADFNYRAPRCGPWPRQAGDNDETVAASQKNNPFGPQPVEWDLDNPKSKDVTFGGSNNSTQADKDTRIAFPGSMQWYVIFQKAAWRLETEGNVRAVVYEAKDLSTPTPAFTGSCINPTGPLTGPSKKSCTYTGQNPPYYIRVFATASDGLTPDRTKGDMPYRINFHRLDCSTKSEACPLNPGEAFQTQWPAQILNPNAQPPDNDMMFFRFVTENSDAGVFPALIFHVEQSLQASPNPLTMSLIDDPPEGDDIQIALNHSPTDAKWKAGVVMSHARDSSPVDPTALPGRLFADGKSLPKHYFFKVHRTSDVNNLGTTPFPIQITYTTNLTYLAPKTMQCFIERTWVGEDDIWLSVLPNSTSTSCQKDSNCFMVGDHFVSNDDDSPGPQVEILDGRLFKSYTTSMRVNVWEDVIDNDNYRLESFDIEALPGNTPLDGDYKKFHFKRSPISLNDQSWEYEFMYRRDHKKPRCAMNGGSLSHYCPASTSCKPQVDDTGECR